MFKNLYKCKNCNGEAASPLKVWSVFFILSLNKRCQNCSIAIKYNKLTFILYYLILLIFSYSMVFVYYNILESFSLKPNNFLNKSLGPFGILLFFFSAFLFMHLIINVWQRRLFEIKKILNQKNVRTDKQKGGTC